MKRRTFIEKFSLSIAPILMACGEESLANNPIKPKNKSVVVIGAGISGLAAAKKLKEAGFEVTVLEAQAKIGGRLRTDRSLGIPFDEGASWIHGPKGNPITDLASQAGAKTFLTNDDSLVIYDFDGSEYQDSKLDPEYDRYESALSAVEKAGSKDKSFETVFNSLYPNLSNNRLWKYMLSAYLEFDYGGDISKLSSKYFEDDEAFNGADVIITNGYDTIAKYLSTDLDIRLNKQVSAIDYSGDKCIVRMDTEMIQSNFVLVTVPLGVLKKDIIKFSPGLPSNKLAAIKNTNMGNVNKFLLVWDRVFWDKNSQYIGYTPTEKGKFNYFMNVTKFIPDTPALMTFAFGDYATETESLSDAEVTKEIMKHLRAIYGNSVPNPSKLLRTKWRQNPYTFGTYSYASNGTTTEDFSTMATAINNKLFFAGEHTSKEYRGTVHGAYLSGIREADKISKLG